MEQSQTQSSKPVLGTQSNFANVHGGVGVFQNYLPPAGAYDEMFVSPGQFRPQYQQFADLLDGLGSEELTRRWSQSQRLIHENGIAYGAYTDQGDSVRPWQLDPLPMLITQQEWQPVAAGLKQRAELLRRVLADLYGPQSLIIDGILPPEILYRHPGFRLSYHGQPLHSQDFLTLYSADLGRAPTGQWWVLADRTEAPSGLGFALENRVMLSRMLPEPFRLCHVQRLAPFFIALQQTLERAIMSEHPYPRIAVLSQGPKHRNFFEDAYLARYLGYTLVEGTDLTVRNYKAWLKTLDGLLQVDVALRRPNSHMCDPLELDGDSQLGTAGLLQAARKRQVALANPLGSGLVESPIFMAYMPRLCQHLLSEELQLPGVATWWCGEKTSLEYTLANFDHLIIKYAYRRRDEQSKMQEQLERLSKKELSERLIADPANFVAQQKVARSTAPILGGRQIRPTQIALRAFVAATDDAFTVMDGGLGRTAAALDSLEVSILAGEGSKDVWILGDQPAEHISLLPKRDASVAIRRSGAELPSRVADNLFWLGRNIERAAAASRLLRTVTLRLTGELATGNQGELGRLIRALANQGQIEQGYVVEGLRDSLPEFEQALPRMILDPEQVGSLRSICDSLFSAASQVRDRVSLDTWRVVVRIKEQFHQTGFQRVDGSSYFDLTDVLNLSNTLLVDLAALGGMVIESMTRSQAFRFLELGRRLEYALQSIVLLKSCLLTTDPISRELLEALLEMSDSLMTYRSRYLATMQLAPVLDLLLTDESNPRSVAYQLEALQKHVEQLPGNTQELGLTTEQKLGTSMLHTIRIVDIEGVSESHNLGEQGQLKALLDGFNRDLPKLANAISHRYLVHAGPARQLSSIEPTP